MLSSCCVGCKKERNIPADSSSKCWGIPTTRVFRDMVDFGVTGKVGKSNVSDGCGEKVFEEGIKGWRIAEPVGEVDVGWRDMTEWLKGWKEVEGMEITSSVVEWREVNGKEIMSVGDWESWVIGAEAAYECRTIDVNWLILELLKELSEVWGYVKEISDWEWVSDGEYWTMEEEGL